MWILRLGALLNFFRAVFGWMGGRFVAAFAFIAAYFGKETSREVLKMVAWKGFITSLMLTVYPALMLFMTLKFMQMGFSLMQDFFASSSIGGISVVEFSGLGAWLFSNLRMAEAFALIFSAIAFRITLSLIPRPGQMKLGL